MPESVKGRISRPPDRTLYVRGTAGTGGTGGTGGGVLLSPLEAGRGDSGGSFGGAGDPVRSESGPGLPAPAAAREETRIEFPFFSPLLLENAFFTLSKMDFAFGSPSLGVIGDFGGVLSTDAEPGLFG